MIMSVSTITPISLRILGRAFSVPLCFSKMAWMKSAKLNNREIIPNAGLIAGESHIVSRAASRSNTEMIERYFCILYHVIIVNSLVLLISYV